MSATTTSESTTEVEKDSRAGRWFRYIATRYALIAVWVVMAIIFSLLLPDLFPTSGAFQAIFGSQTPLIFLGVAVVMLLVVGEFDLSFAANFGLAATLFPSLVVLYGWSTWMAALGAIVASVIVGTINAIFAVKVGLNSVVVTLATASLVEGLTLYAAQETSVAGLDPELSNITLTPFLGLPLIFWYGLALTLIFAFVLTSTPVGRHMLFVGSNREVARLAGIEVDRVRFGAYLTSGLVCGLAGVLISAGLGGYDPGSSNTWLLPVFAAVFLGTAVVMPGRFNPIGMFIAAYFLITGVVGLQLMGFAGWVTNVFYGAVLLIAVTVSHVARRRIRS